MSFNKDISLKQRTVSIEEHQLADLIDVVELNFLLDNFCNAVGIAAAIIDLQGEVLISSRWQRICTDFHRINPTTCARCIESDTDLALHLNAGKNFAVYKCNNGMTDAASPIIIEGRHLANVFVGQFLLAPPDREFFAQQAWQVGFNPLDYLNALSEVPIVSEEKLPAILGFLSGFAKLVASIGLQRLRAERVSIELSLHQQKLELLVEQRTHALNLANEQLQHDIKVRQKTEQYEQFRSLILELLVGDNSLPHILQSIVLGVEQLNPKMRCSLLLLDHDGKHLNHGISPSLPDFYNTAIDGVEIGLGVGSCGTAAFTGARVVVENIQTHPYWMHYKALAAKAALGACWSQPICSTAGKVLGTFAIYHREANTPTSDDIHLIEQTAHLASIAIERKNAEDALQYSEQRFRDVSDAAGEYLWEIDPNMVYTYVSNRARDVKGYAPEALLGHTPMEFMPDEDILPTGEIVYRAIANKAPFRLQHRDITPCGELKWEEVSGMPYYDATGTLIGLRGTGLDITERKRAEEDIQRLAFYDSLTQLPNRRFFLDRLKQALPASVRSGNQGALLFIDLDNFKIINDMYGHAKGDLLLRQAALRLLSCVRKGDTVARFGGDEFLVLLEGMSPSRTEAIIQTEIVCENIRYALGQPYQVDTHHFRSTPSIGITLFDGSHLAVDELIKQADIAMYQSKKIGRNTACFFDPVMQTAIIARANQEADLRHAIFEQTQLKLYYQVQVDATGRAMGAEALVRWHHPQLGLMLPEQFIALAEESGLILPLGHWVLATACQQLVAWATQATKAHLTLAVNISARQFKLPTFVDEVLALVEHYGVNPAKLKLEITESMLMDNVDDIIAKMTALKSQGIGFSMDDFGTGYSSLQYLKRLPLDQIKIDQSFVRDLVADENDRTIVRTIIAMAKSLNLDIIAEGVETEMQRTLLLNKGCTRFQGYLFGKPVPIEALNVSEPVYDLSRAVVGGVKSSAETAVYWV